MERLSFAAPAQGRAAEASVTDVVNRPSRGQALGSIALPSAAKRLGIALPSAAKCRGHEALLVAVEDQRPPANATCHIAQCHRDSTHAASKPSPVSHRPH